MSPAPHLATSLALAIALVAGAPGAAGPAAAAPAGARLEIEGELPCSRDELRDALALRLGDDAVTIAIQVAADHVTLEVDGRRDVVALDGATGRAAARRIALAVADLAIDALPAGALAPAPARRPATTVAARAAARQPRRRR
ncbi:MAG: hypothetical protein H6708_17860 [Kofleriaceae bacterium]|nr:hypothetical protein [Kofleriaceae bacterium]